MPAGAGPPELHLFFFPFMAKGHALPLIDMASLFAARGVRVTIIATHLTAFRYRSAVAGAPAAGHHITIEPLTFPCSDFDLPESCDDMSVPSSAAMIDRFLAATMALQPQFEQLARALLPDAIVSDMMLPWTAEVARELGVPRIGFHGTGCFALAVNQSVRWHRPHERVLYDEEPFSLPGLPHEIFITKRQMPEYFLTGHGEATPKLFSLVAQADEAVSTLLVNTFYELEKESIDHFAEVSGKQVWPLGPVSLWIKDPVKKVQRGRSSGESADADGCLSWLESKPYGSVLYVSFGSLSRLGEAQVAELALGLKAAEAPFVWVVRAGEDGRDRLPAGYEERVRDKGLVVRGWAPQLAILEHPAVGGFLTHCGWNSVLEAVAAAVPVLTWPVLGEQFYNEKLVVDRLKLGVRVGVEAMLQWGPGGEMVGSVVGRDVVERGVRRLMDGGDDAAELRARVRRMAETAAAAVEDGGSSYANLTLLIEDLGRQCRGGKGQNPSKLGFDGCPDHQPPGVDGAGPLDSQS